MCEDERRDPDDQGSPMIASEKATKDTSSGAKRTHNKKHSSNKSPLARPMARKLVVMQAVAGRNPSSICVWRFEALAGPTARANSDERLINGPRRALFVDIVMGKRGDSAVAGYGFRPKLIAMG